MIRVERILFPTDFSEPSRSAQAYACALAERFHAELRLLHVLQDVLLMMPEPGSALSLQQNYLLDLKQQAESALDHLLSAESAQAKRVVRATRMGHPATEIIQDAAEHKINLIVIGTHGRSGLRHALLGSVAERVVRQAPCPVLTVHPTGHQFLVPKIDS
jgi:universal stress protein A